MIDIWQIVDFFGTRLGRTILFFFIIFVTFALGKYVIRYSRKPIKEQMIHFKMDPTKFAFLMHFLAMMIYVVGFILALSLIPSFRNYSTSLFAGAGVIAIIVGFASQRALSNVISGLLIVVFRPFRVGDKIRVGERITGIVEDVTMRHTIIKNWDNNRVIIPNGIISEEEIENFDIRDEKDCKILEIGISHTSSIDKAIKIIRDVTQKHPDFIDVRTSEQKKKKVPAVKVLVSDLTDYSVVLKLYAWATDPTKAYYMGCDLRKAIKERFDKAKIGPPFHSYYLMKKTKKK